MPPFHGDLQFCFQGGDLFRRQHGSGQRRTLTGPWSADAAEAIPTTADRRDAI